MEQRVDALRVVQDAAYAASLTDAQWRELTHDPTWHELVGEYHEMAAPVMNLYAAQLGIPAAAQPARTSAAVDLTPSSFDVVGKRVPRLHGLGVVTSLG